MPKERTYRSITRSADRSCVVRKAGYRSSRRVIVRKLCLFPCGESVAEIIGINTEQSTNILKRAWPTGIVGGHPFFRLFEKAPLAAGCTGNRMLEGRNGVFHDSEHQSLLRLGRCLGPNPIKILRGNDNIRVERWCKLFFSSHIAPFRLSRKATPPVFLVQYISS